MAITNSVLTSRQPFAKAHFWPVGPYEQLDGTVFFAVDPAHPANRSITDLSLAPGDANGRVHCTQRGVSSGQRNRSGAITACCLTS